MYKLTTYGEWTDLSISHMCCQTADKLSITIAPVNIHRSTCCTNFTTFTRSSYKRWASVLPSRSFRRFLLQLKLLIVFYCCPCCCCCCCGVFQLQLISFVVSCTQETKRSKAERVGMRRNEMKWYEMKWMKRRNNSQQFVLSAALFWHSCLLSFLVFQGMRPSIQVNAESSAAQEGRVGVSRSRRRPSKPRRSENKSCPGCTCWGCNSSCIILLLYC